MLSNLLNEKTVRIADGKKLDWKTSIKEASKPLLEDGTILNGYVSSMIDVVEKEGPYINIGPVIALAHAQPNGFVNRVGMALLKTKDSIALTSKDHMINIWFVLAAVDSNSHLESIKELTKLLTDPNNVEKLLSANSVCDLLNVIKNVDLNFAVKRKEDKK
ncbi:PTS mannitol transporter subunit IIA [Oenococcus oeni S25]|uniref:PTS sugar transporter subunit IIA n=1 Tax=Oenococcus oeni TaxID=1247 RepID=UPI00050EF444|nr:PTS sugar transporter subunit IIA [Oenococcus oeni]KGO16076.1 PTS mannitol transporter subunit IIA [Oenococcus oeni X2L]KGH56214.1 PTS mannitol transporter subunit IIA [Oenococcus oeni S22]KGH70190.1 PTS mannitol transporter subunit IIA [Oenococcus oeni S25]KGH79938.1 PTS mannitol transporter subunit IIA [Oenococcus oeni IOEB_0607]KMQ38650.1 PTS mannitol transporter subunit IIA [Oenococcus oeni]